MKTTTKDLLHYLGLSLCGLAAMLLLIHQLGEVHGLIATVVICIVQYALLFMRTNMLQRELAALRREHATADTKSS